MKNIDRIQHYTKYILTALFGIIVAASFFAKKLSIAVFSFIIIFLAFRNWYKIVWLLVPILYLGFSSGVAWPLVELNLNFPIIIILVIPAIIHISEILLNKRDIGSSLDWSLIVPLLFFTWFLFISLLWSSNIDYGLQKAILFSINTFLPAMILLTTNVQGYSERNVGLSVQLLGFLIAIQLPFFGIDEYPYPGRLRLPGTNPIWLSRIAVLAIIVSIWNLSFLKGRKGLIMRGIVMLTSFWVVVVSGSRGPVAAFIIAVIVANVIIIFFKGFPINKLKSTVMTGGFFVVLIILLFAGSKIMPDRMQVRKDPVKLQQDKNFIGRITYLNRAYSLFSESPLYGKGVGGFSSGSRDYPHNLVMEIIVEGGIVLMVLFIGIIVNILRKIRLNSKHVMGKLILFLSACLFFLFSGDLSTNCEWLILGVAISRLSNDNVKLQKEQIQER